MAASIETLRREANACSFLTSASGTSMVIRT
jgi:hypothetical protein